MDPVTQGVVGATLSQNIAKNAHAKIAGLLGLLGGMAADLDVFIRSSSDPLLAIEYHRQFTHSLIFIPIGGLICAFVLYSLIAKKRQLSFKLTWLYCTLGYATHALLDACTSYGTQLLWPFSDTRFAWNIISIVDPIYTLPLVILFVGTLITANKRLAILALAWIVAYPMLGVFQRERVEQRASEWVDEMQLTASRISVKPTFGNLLVWKAIVETDDHFFSLAIRSGKELRLIDFSKIKRFSLNDDLPWLSSGSQQFLDIARFNAFSDGYLAVDPDNNRRIMDIRYTMLPTNINGLWGIELSPDKNAYEHVDYYIDRSLTDDEAEDFKRMVFDQL